MAWKGESRRHSLARKGVKTAKGRRKPRSHYETDYGKNLKMNDDVYKLRRQVINILYDAKDMVDLPRIDVRITSKMKKNTLAVARMEDNIIWVQEGSINIPEYDLREIVYHEILHAVFGVPHIKGDPLMDKYHNANLSRKELDNNFKRLAKKYGGKIASGISVNNKEIGTLNTSEKLRVGIMAEYDAVNLYEDLAENSPDDVKKVFLEVAKEEKTHVGEFQELLLKHDPEQKKELKNGKKEVKELLGDN